MSEGLFELPPLIEDTLGTANRTNEQLGATASSQTGHTDNGKLLETWFDLEDWSECGLDFELQKAQRSLNLPTVIFPRGVSALIHSPTDLLRTRGGDVLVGLAISRREFEELKVSLWGTEAIPEHVMQTTTINQLTGCWERRVYRDEKRRARYGVVTDVNRDARNELAHRFFWRQLVIPAGGPEIADQALDHRCRNKTCCYPRHLEPTTIAENTRRGRLDRRHESQPPLFWTT